MESQVDLEQTVEGYTLAELERLERQFKVRSYIKAGTEEPKVKKKKVLVSDTKPDNILPVWAPVICVLPSGISDAEKLKQVRLRRERMQAKREQDKKDIEDNPDNEDFIIKLNSMESPFIRVRLAEVKGRSYWYRRSQEDYVQNWFLKFTPVRRYYEEFTLETLEESSAAKLGERFIELTTGTTLDL